MTERADIDQISRDIAACTTSHLALVTHLRSIDGDPTRPSKLPNWSVGHVLSHIARNADGHIAVMAGRPQYAGGMASRNADIESGSKRTWAGLVDDVEATCRAVEQCWNANADWESTAELIMGERPKAMLPFFRWREVEIHRVDLGLGYEFADLPAEYVRKDLRLWEMLWLSRRPMGLTVLPDAALALAPADRLAWMTGRAQVDGLEPAGLF